MRNRREREKREIGNIKMGVGSIGYIPVKLQHSLLKPFLCVVVFFWIQLHPRAL